MNVAIEALDALGLALANHGHVWTDREREFYEKATAALSNGERPLIPSDCFWITDEGKLRIARKVAENDGKWTLTVFRNPSDAYAGNALKTQDYVPA